MTTEELLEKCINTDLIALTLSNPQKKGGVLPDKKKIRPVVLHEETLYQVCDYTGKKVYHKNYRKEEAVEKLLVWIKEDYKQAQFIMTDAQAHILSGKNGQTVRYKKSSQVRQQNELSHNRTKRYILPEGKPVGFLVDLGVMTPEGKIVRQRYDKYRQINRFLEFIEDILPQLDRNREQTILDFGCGKSYLTFAMYYYLKVLKGYDVRIIGLDLKEDVIEHCNRLKDEYGYEKLQFFVGDIASYNDVNTVDMVVTLHACDTATDYALAKAVKWGAQVILSVPCCQHEANKTIANDMLAPVMNYGILKERMAAIVTDAARAELLKAHGYDAQILEFIDMEHTPKNLLIRAVKTGKENKAAGKAAENMEEALHIDLTLKRLLQNGDKVE